MGITPLVSSQEKMVKVSVTLLTVASVFLTATRPVDCDLAEIETLTKCMAGTKLEAMLKEGMGKCSSAPASSWDGNDCPTYEQSLSHVETVHSDEACVLQSLGWVDAENNLKKAKYVVFFYLLLIVFSYFRYAVLSCYQYLVLFYCQSIVLSVLPVSSS